MAFFRFSRDKRGYEHFYLVEPLTNRKGKSRPRVLYWYRTPPNVRVGRPPFDAEMRRAIEAQYPDVTFDWTKIVEAPIPSADAEKWRERRRVERAERAARKTNVAAGLEDERESPDEPEHAASIDEDAGEAELLSSLTGDAEPGGDSADTASQVPVADQPSSQVAAAAAIGGDAPPPPTADGGRGGRKRRRRHRGRGQSAPRATAAPGDAAVESTIDASGSGADTHASDDPIGEPSGE